jgi:hypothetical protein
MRHGGDEDKPAKDRDTNVSPPHSTITPSTRAANAREPYPFLPAEFCFVTAPRPARLTLLVPPCVIACKEIVLAQSMLH